MNKKKIFHKFIRRHNNQEEIFRYVNKDKFRFMNPENLSFIESVNLCYNTVKNTVLVNSIVEDDYYAAFCIDYKPESSKLYLNLFRFEGDQIAEFGRFSSDYSHELYLILFNLNWKNIFIKKKLKIINI